VRVLAAPASVHCAVGEGHKGIHTMDVLLRFAEERRLWVDIT
jgi:hypothetical protein